MKTFRLSVVFLCITALASPCFAHHIAVVVSHENTLENLTSMQLGKILRAETRKWADGRDIMLVFHRSSPGEALTLQRLNKMSATQWQQWMNEHKDQITLVDSDHDALNLVANTPGAIGLVDVRSVNDRVKVVHVDGKLPLENGYLPH